MTRETVRSRAEYNTLMGALGGLPDLVKGGSDAARALLTSVGLTALGRIHRAFIVKARGGTDEAGDRWQPLSPKTIAYSRRPGRSKAEKKRAVRPSQALNAKQQARWWAVYRQALAWNHGNKAVAARIAWSRLKAEGAQTLLGKYGNRRVEILRDTGLLLNSLSPAVGGGGGGPAEQVFRLEPGAVVVGTNRKGAAGHHNGIPGRLPQRRLWPPVDKWPATWWQDLLASAKQGLLTLAVQTVKGTA